MTPEKPSPTVLKVHRPRDRTPAYPWIGLFSGVIVTVFLAYPLILLLNGLHAHFSAGASLKALKLILKGFSPPMWPLLILYGLIGGISGMVLGFLFRRLQENRLRLDNLHHEFEIQVTTLRHHYKNLALGIQGFAQRIRRKMAGLEEHFHICAREECLNFGKFYQDFDALQQSVAILEEASGRLTHTLGQELLFLRALTSEFPHSSPQDLYPFLVHCISDLLGLRFRERHILVEINGQPFERCQERLWVAFDPHILEVVFQNLLSNAMKNGDHIQVRVTEENNRILVEVADNGPGFEVSHLQQQLLTAAPRQDEESTHLGIRVSLHLLEKCQGRLLVQSRPGEGARFIVELPKREVPGD